MANNNKNTNKIPNNIFNNAAIKLLFDFLKRKDKQFSQFSQHQGIDFVDFVLNEFQIDYQVSQADLNRIPKKTPFLVISNYPLGGLEIFITIKVFTQIHPNFKIIVNKYFDEILPLCSHISNVSSELKRRISHKYQEKLEELLQSDAIDDGLAIFPASLVKTFQSSVNTNIDNAWDLAIIKAIKKAQVAILPVYFKGNKSWLAQLWTNLPAVFNASGQKAIAMPAKRKGNLVMRIGNIIPVEKQNEYKSNYLFSRYLSSRVYALGTGLDAKKFRLVVPKIYQPKAEPIIDAVPTDVLVDEINAISQQYLLFESGDYQVICAPSLEMPKVLREIGRLREITFREVGEGSNKSIDLDDYDFYYRQLIVWDKANSKIAGAYRIGIGEEIIEKLGLRGFYIHSLFKIKQKATAILTQSIELGRSFIVKEYQRKPLSLFLLWKGILYFLLKNENYRYLIGPASISNDFSKISKNLIVNYIRNYHYDYEIAKYFKPRKQFKIRKIKNIDQTLFLKSEQDIKKVDKFILEIENEQGIPVLFKKYIKLNAKIVGFNVDPNFNNCLDGLILLDVFNVPKETIKSLSKEIKDESILQRFGSIS